MICFTGDIHHMSMRTGDQKYLRGTEASAAIEMADIAFRVGVKITFFVTGRAVKDEPDIVKRLASYDNIQLGGHTYNAFKPDWLYKGLFNKVFRSVNGPDWWQHIEVSKTIEEILSCTGKETKVWRDHAYKSNHATNAILEKLGIQVVSNVADPNFIHPYREGEGVLQLPINIWPDHDHIFHADVTPESTANCQ